MPFKCVHLDANSTNRKTKQERSINGFYFIKAILFQIMFVYAFLTIILSITEAANVETSKLPQEIAFVSKVKPQTRPEQKCDCYNTSENYQIEVECSCSGKALMRIPSNLPKNMSKLSVTDSEMRFFTRADLDPYRQNLKEM